MMSSLKTALLASFLASRLTHAAVDASNGQLCHDSVTERPGPHSDYCNYSGNLRTLGKPTMPLAMFWPIPFETCRNSCLENPDCISFSFHHVGLYCSWFNVTIASMEPYGPTGTGENYWNRECFDGVFQRRQLLVDLDLEKEWNDRQDEWRQWQKEWKDWLADQKPKKGPNLFPRVWTQFKKLYYKSTKLSHDNQDALNKMVLSHNFTVCANTTLEPRMSFRFDGPSHGDKGGGASLPLFTARLYPSNPHSGNAIEYKHFPLVENPQDGTWKEVNLTGTTSNASDTWTFEIAMEKQPPAGQVTITFDNLEINARTISPRRVKLEPRETPLPPGSHVINVGQIKLLPPGEWPDHTVWYDDGPSKKSPKKREAYRKTPPGVDEILAMPPGEWDGGRDKLVWKPNWNVYGDEPNMDFPNEFGPGID